MKKHLLKVLTTTQFAKALIDGVVTEVKLISYNSDGSFYCSVPNADKFKKMYLPAKAFVLSQEMVLHKALKKLYKLDLVSNIDDEVSNLDDGLIKINLEINSENSGSLLKMVNSTYLNYAVNGENSELFFGRNGRFVRVSLGCFDLTAKGNKKFYKALKMAIEHIKTIEGTIMHVSLKNLLISE